MVEKLSEHFTREEFEYSDTAKNLHISNIMDSVSLSNAKHTCTYLLEPLRKELTTLYKQQVYIHINSGFRGSSLNKALKGVTKSQHLTGCATDCYFYVLNNNKKQILDFDKVYSQIKTLVKSNKISLDQCIDEHNGTSRWIHVSCSSQLKNNRKQFLKYNGKNYWLDLT